uniref:Uncharacterized protein n=1 Tax=Physcomitrium patens TaxID=3218 RepID=A0A2K1LAH4_PHYPA|nr:hypothetical protein PHYPA_001449 [Physcomitrium patens]
MISQLSSSVGTWGIRSAGRICDPGPRSESLVAVCLAGSICDGVWGRRKFCLG